MHINILKGIIILVVTFTTNAMAQGPGSAENLLPVAPNSPRLPNCGSSFPGSSEWNACWAEFQQEMNKFQQQMQEYGQQVSAAAAKDENNGNNFYSQSQSFSSAMGSSQSSVMTNGYAISASGIPISTSTQGSKIMIKFAIGNFDSFESKVEGQEIEMKMKSEGRPKWAKIRAPQGINLAEVKVERSSDTILVTGPVLQNQGRNSATSPMSSAMFQSAYAPMASMNSRFMPIYSPFSLMSGSYGQSTQRRPQMWVF